MFARHDVVRAESFDLNSLLHELGKLLRRTIGEHIALTSHHLEELPPVSADPGVVEQVVLNLVVNARDAMPDGGRVTITTGLLTVGEDEGRDGELRAGDYVTLSVADDGDGMTEAVATRAFDPFFTTKPEGSGTGLGLATVYGAVTKAGGAVQLHSKPGQGTEVKVCLPVAAARPEAPAPENITPVAFSAEGTVLVVEDDAGVRKVTVRILESHGYDVLSASGPVEGLELARIHGENIGVVITDVVMPGMSGAEMAKRLRRARPDLPVIFVSGYTGRPGELPDGARFISKPFIRLELLREVAAAWRAPRQPAPTQ